MSIWFVIALAWVVVMLLALAVARMAARGDSRQDRHGTFSVDEMGERTALQATNLPVPEPHAGDVKPPTERREPEVGSSR